MQIDYEAPSDTELNLFLKDFTIDGVSLTEFYLGILMWRRNGNYKLVTTAAKMGDATAVSIRVEIGYSDVGDWAMLPVSFLVTDNARTAPIPRSHVPVCQHRDPRSTLRYVRHRSTSRCLLVVCGILLIPSSTSH